MQRKNDNLTNETKSTS